ncbi:alpha/beta hydrolase-fold protein [Lutimonas sp.]|uniref:alpha/beta hydrolase-fold protein n=1 Tax=Lutimonas sp. TaxID=1872403 RepID=UPI003D9BBE55
MKRTANIFALSLVFIIIFQFQAVAQNASAFVIGTSHTIASKILDEERTYILELPESYATSSKEYPVLVLLDGEVTYHSHSGILKQMVQGGQIPEMIIVAITNVDRVRDYTPTNYLTNLNGSSAAENQKTSGGSAAFLDFIEEELLPQVEANYRSNSFKIMVGISHGGLLVGSAYLSEKTSCNAFISMDPSFWWDDQYVVKQIDNIDIGQIQNKRIYVSTADKFENFDRIPGVYKANVNAHELFNTTVKNKGVSPENIELAYFKEENHWTVALMSLYHGMQFIYKGLRMKNMSNNSIDEIESYYKTNYNGAFLPPENDINSIGYDHLREENYSKALAFFTLNTTNYPESSNAYDSLGEVYMVMDDRENALRHYKKSIKLDPNNENAKQMIGKLQTE